MRKVALAMFISLDGYIEAPNRKLIPPKFSPDIEKYWVKDNIENADMMLYGRVCYEGMVAFWTSAAAPRRLIARLSAR